MCVQDIFVSAIKGKQPTQKDETEEIVPCSTSNSEEIPVIIPFKTAPGFTRESLNLYMDVNKSVHDVDDRTELDDSVADPNYEPDSVSYTDDSISNSDVIGSEAINEATPGPVKNMAISVYASASCSRDQVVSQRSGPAQLRTDIVSHTDDGVSDNDVSGSESISDAVPWPVKEGRVMGQSAYASTSCSRDQVVSQMTGPAQLRNGRVSHTDDGISDNGVSGSGSISEAAPGPVKKRRVMGQSVYASVKCSVLLSRKRDRKAGCKQVYDKTHHCIFCGVQIRNKISRHLINVHSDETVIREIMFLPKRSSLRRAKLQKLANEGNFKHNVDVIRKGRGEIVVGKREPMKSATEYTACEYCKRFEAKKNLWRHMKGCTARKDYYEGSNVDPPKKILAVKRGTELVANAAASSHAYADSVQELLERMRDGEIKDAVMSDELICREAGLRMSGLGNKDDRKQDDVYRVSNSARTLGRLLLTARKSIPNVSLTQLIEPCRFDLVVDVAKKMSTEKEFPSLNVGRTIGILLTKVCSSKYCVALREKDCTAQEDAMAFKKLIEREWNDRVNRTAIKQIQREKRNTVPVIPLTEDLQMFRDYLVTNIEQKTQQLAKDHSTQQWVLLAKFVLSRLILFNKRRRAEVRELKVSEYLARPKWKDSIAGELSMALSQTDRVLVER